MAKEKQPSIFTDRGAGEKSALSSFERSLGAGLGKKVPAPPAAPEGTSGLPTVGPRLQRVLTASPAVPPAVPVVPAPIAPVSRPAAPSQPFSFKPFALIGAMGFVFAVCCGTCTSFYGSGFTLNSPEVRRQTNPMPIAAAEPKKAPLQELTDGNFDAFIEQATLPVVVAFKVPLCRPCQETTTTLEEASLEYEGRLFIVSVDVGQSKGVVSKYEITSEHMVVGFEGGKMNPSTKKTLSDETVQEVIDELLK